MPFLLNAHEKNNYGILDSLNALKQKNYGFKGSLKRGPRLREQA